jgi:hypothetical protein
MSDAMVEFEGRVRERAYFLWEREGRPEGRADEHWRRAAAELEAAARERDAGQRSDAMEPDGPSASVAQRTGGTARKRRGPVRGAERAGTTPAAERAPSSGSSRKRAKPVDGSVPPRSAKRQQQASVAPSGSPKRGTAAGATATSPQAPTMEASGR